MSDVEGIPALFEKLRLAFFRALVHVVVVSDDCRRVTLLVRSDRPTRRHDPLLKRCREVLRQASQV